MWDVIEEKSVSVCCTYVHCISLFGVSLYLSVLCVLLYLSECCCISLSLTL